MWYHIVPTNYREKFFSCSHSIAFLWFIPLNIFFWFTHLVFHERIRLFISFPTDRQPIVPITNGARISWPHEWKFLESLYLDVEILVIGYYISFFLLLQQITTNLAALNNVKFIVSGFWRSGFEMGLTVPKSVRRQGHTSSEALGEDPLACLFQLWRLPAFLGSWLFPPSSMPAE